MSIVISLLFRPWREARTWGAVAFLTLDVLFGTIAFALVVTLLVTSASLVVVFPVAIPVAWLLFVVSRGLGHAERSRLASLLGTDLRDPIPPLRAATWWKRWRERLGCTARWKEIAYHLLLLPVGVGAFVLMVAAWCGSLALCGLPFYVSHLPGASAKFGLFEVGDDASARLLGLAGVVGVVFIAPWLTRALAAVRSALARKLIGPRPQNELVARVNQLEARRVAAVDSAEAERRRIERDLHDGAQQRIVALAMDLGQARERFDENPDAARELVVSAHEEAKAALGELRDLVRGIHPAVLADRGLDAALSAVVARSSVPVRLTVDLPERPPAAVESAVYFVVMEALANVDKHAQASRAAVSIARRGDRLVVEVTDDGIGNADAARGTGLQGLAERVQGLGGWMHVMSPAGGPTTLLVEIPCAS